MNRAGWLLLVAAAAACGGHAPIAVRTVTIAAPAPAPLPRLGAVTLARLVDLRPPALRVSRGPQQDQRFSLLMVGSTGAAFMNGVRTEGQTLVAGDRLRFVGADPEPTAALAAYVAGLLGAAAGQPVRSVDARLALDAPDQVAAALGAADGVVVVPLLDQLDVTALSSRNTMTGGSSYAASRSATEVTYRDTAGLAVLASHTDTFANVRLRLLVLEVVGGQVTARHVIYGRGTAADLGQAIDGLGRELTRGLAARFAPPALPLPIVPAAAPPGAATESP